jgi:hypothetical protein
LTVKGSRKVNRKKFTPARSRLRNYDEPGHLIVKAPPAP